MIGQYVTSVKIVPSEYEFHFILNYGQAEVGSIVLSAAHVQELSDALRKNLSDHAIKHADREELE